MSPGVTVIVAVYNSVKYLDECLRSVVSQTVAPAQIILIDDGSTDGTGGLCDLWASEYSIIQVVHQSNGGLSQARNRGLDLAEGEYVVFVDADDMLHDTFVERMTAMIADRHIARCGIVEGSACRWPHMSRVNDSADAVSAIERMLYQDGWHNGVWAHMYRRDLFDGLRFRDRTLYEDLDIIYRIYERAGKGIGFSSDRLYFYRRHADSLLATFAMPRLQVLDVVDRMDQYFSDDSRLQSAAQHRRFSAYFNMLGLMSRYLSSDQARLRCWPTIEQLRKGVLTNRRSRLKNRAGALLSFLGPRISCSISKYLVR